MGVAENSKLGVQEAGFVIENNVVVGVVGVPAVGCRDIDEILAVNYHIVVVDEECNFEIGFR